MGFHRGCQRSCGMNSWPIWSVWKMAAQDHRANSASVTSGPSLSCCLRRPLASLRSNVRVPYLAPVIKPDPGFRAVSSFAALCTKLGSPFSAIESRRGDRCCSFGCVTRRLRMRTTQASMRRHIHHLVDMSRPPEDTFAAAANILQGPKSNEVMVMIVDTNLEA